MTQATGARVVLFADVCSSTPLYERAGDAGALDIVGRTLDGLSEIAVAKRGRIVRSKGDDLLCLFERASEALAAAEAMVEVQPHGAGAVHVGIHAGDVIEARGDVFGDTVNVAARMLDLAKPGEILVTRRLYDDLAAPQRARLSALGERTVKGKREPIEVFSLVFDDGDCTQANVARALVPAPLTLRVDIACLLTETTLSVSVGEVLMGRSRRCDVVMPQRFVSREHATISVAPGRVTLRDHSSTGTWLCDADGDPVLLRREEAVLNGGGMIFLGAEPGERPEGPRVEYRVEIVAS